MKTAISLPDSVFEEAEALAKQLGLSRSELYKSAARLSAEARSSSNPEQTERSLL